MKKSLIVLALFVMVNVLLAADVSRSQAASLLATITVQTTPKELQLTPDGSKLLVSNETADTVSIINTATDSVVNISVHQAPGPIRVLPNGSKAYVVNTLSNDVSVINVATNSFIKNIAVGNNPVTLSRTDDGTKVYVANKASNTVSVIDTLTDTVVAPSPISVGTAPNVMAKTPDGTKLYVANETSNSISIISTSSSAVIATITLPSLPPNTSVDPGSIHFLPNGTKAYVANRGCVAPSTACLSVSVAPTISVVNVASNSLFTTITTNVGAAGDAPHAMRVSLDGSKLYLVNKHGNAVKVIDTASNVVTKTISLQAGSCTSGTAGSCPVRIELTPDGSYAYVVEERPLAVEGTLTGICTGAVPAICGGVLTDTVVWRSNVGNSPTDLEITPGGKAYVSNSGSNTVSVWVDSDGDGCPDANEEQTTAGTEASGGRRDPANPWDFFNPSHDHQNRVDDILMVVGQYFKDDTDANPGLPPYAPGYNVDTDRTPLGPQAWNLGPPNGQQRVDDILAMVKQYFHGCP